MEKESGKFEAIVEAAKSLFWKHGIRRVTIEEICQVGGVSKMTFYKYFSNKTAVAKYIIEDITATSLKSYNEIMNSDISYDRKVKKMIDIKLENSNNISQELIYDLYKYRNEEIAKTIEEIKDKMFNFLLNDFKKAQKLGEIRSDIKPEFILFFLNKISEMMSDSELVSMYPDPKNLVAEVTNMFFYGIMLPKEDIDK